MGPLPAGSRIADCALCTVAALSVGGHQQSVDLGQTTSQFGRVGPRFADSSDVKKEGTVNRFSSEKGAIGYILMWLLGIPIPILLAIFLLRGCDWRKRIGTRDCRL